MLSASSVRVALASVAGLLGLVACERAPAPVSHKMLVATACRQVAERFAVGDVAAEVCSADTPAGRVVGLKVTLDGNGVYVPKSAYADLDDVASVTLAAVAAGYHMTIRGGDAADAYIVVLTFTPSRLTERTLAIETGDVTERTAYLPTPVID